MSGVHQACPVLHDIFERYLADILWSASYYEFVSWLDWSHSFGEEYHRGICSTCCIILGSTWYQHGLLLLVMIIWLRWYLPGFCTTKLLLYLFHIPLRSESNKSHTYSRERELSSFSFPFNVCFCKYSLTLCELFKRTGERGVFNSWNEVIILKSQLDITCHSITEHFGNSNIPKIIS